VKIHQNLYHSCFSDLIFRSCSKLSKCTETDPSFITGISNISMTAKDDNDWSDSDDDVLSEVETSVLLGVPDGAIDTADINDAAVSRIGGHPV
jgi:hypothetical protein